MPADPGALPVHLAPLRSGKQKRKVLVVGQTPPPFGGQAVMIEALLELQSERLSWCHVRLNFSSDMDSVGKFRSRKVAILLRTILQVWWQKLRHRPQILYYPPAGPNKVPVLRDIVLLTAIRWLFKYTVFHFHAGGVSTFRDQLPGLYRWLFDLAYSRPTLAIRTSALNPDDGAALGAGRSIIVPNGLPDMRRWIKADAEERPYPKELTILFAGVLIPSKGVAVLIDAFVELVQRGHPIRLELMGKWGDEGFREQCRSKLIAGGSEDKVRSLGVLSGKDKATAFSRCDIFCFPSFFEAESFGLVLVEAMQFAKPVVSTHWRGIPSVVEHGVNGLLVPIKDHMACADSLEELILDEDLRRNMGRAGRRTYDERFTIEQFHRAMEEALLDID